MLVALAGAELALGTGSKPAPTQPVPSDAHFLVPAFVQALVLELDVDSFFWPIMCGAAGTFGKPVDRRSASFLDTSRTTPGGAFLVRCCLLYRRG